MPGVTYEHIVQFTPHGPVSMHVVVGPRPTGLYALKPVLSNGAITGRETVTSMEKRVASTASVVGVNGDLFNWATGRPSGIFMHDRVLANPPYGDRSSVGISDDGTLDVRRVEFFGTWQGTGQRRVLNDLNVPPTADGISLFTPDYGPATPKQAGVTEAVIEPMPAAAPNTDLVGPVVRVVTGGGGTAIPRDGAVLVARGTTAQRLAAEAPVDVTATVRLIFRPDWSDIASAIGGGPVIVRDGGPVFRANEAFSADQLSPRNPRTAVGQMADGRVILLVVDGREGGYSVGVTAWELAQTMVRLGAVTASALDAGGSSTLAFDGQLLNRPSDPGGERPVSTALMLMYYGIVAAQPANPVVSPNGDGAGETQSLSYKVSRPSAVTETLVAPDGSDAFTQTVQRNPGRYKVAFPPSLVAPPPASKARAKARQAIPEGRWQLSLSATDDQGQTSTASQPFSVNDTLGFLKLSRARYAYRPGGKLRLLFGATLTRPAHVKVTIETSTGVVVRTLAKRVFVPGRARWEWDGHTIGGKNYAFSGTYVVRVSATNGIGTAELTKRFAVLRGTPAKQPKSRG